MHAGPQVKQRAWAGEYALVYLTPELASTSADLLRRLHATKGIALIAVDEAHCAPPLSLWGATGWRGCGQRRAALILLSRAPRAARLPPPVKQVLGCPCAPRKRAAAQSLRPPPPGISEYGHDFRPAFRQLSLLRDVLPDVPLMALTATATQRVREVGPARGFSGGQAFATWRRQLLLLLLRRRRGGGAVRADGHAMRPRPRDPGCATARPAHVAKTAPRARPPARPPVRQDIKQQLRLGSTPAGCRTWVTSFERANLHFSVTPKAGGLEANLEPLVEEHHRLRAVGRAPPATLIYCPTTAEVDAVAAALAARGVPAARYHAKLPPGERAGAHSAFLRDDVPVLAATIAYGMVGLGTVGQRGPRG
jgi:superfamily II DNA helicase RecQ